MVEFRDYLVPRYGIRVALDGWKGTVAGHKYFEILDTWREVEAVDQDAVKVWIHSLEQLDAEENGILTLVRLEESNSEDKEAVNLNTLVIDIIDKIENPKDMALFQEKINNSGYCINSEYDNYNFVVKDIQRYKVNEEFPCLRKRNISSSIEDVRYTLLLDEITDFREE